MLVAIKDIEFYVRTMRMRMPFKFGNVVADSLTALHVAMDLELGNGRRARGWAADMLSPRWFDKDPSKEMAEGIRDLVDGARAAAAAYQEAGRVGAIPFAIWEEGYEASRAWGRARGTNALLASNGAALMERALIDGLGVALDQPYFALLQDNVLGLDLGRIYPELEGVELATVPPPAPVRSLYVRHTVGLVDPIRTAAIAPEERLNDGLPQSLEECIQRDGLRYFKIKIGGDPMADFERLAEIAALLNESGAEYHITLDGNEQYSDAVDLMTLLQRIEKGLGQFYHRILYVEQPMDRALSLDPAFTRDIELLARKRPLLIDESDGSLASFRSALNLGYSGVSSKSCKGLVKALANSALAWQRTVAGHPCFVSAEDLTAVPVVSLHQDLAHVAALGIRHVERNGHHYVRGLDHLSAAERMWCFERHGDLYRFEGQSGFLDIRAGQIAVGSLQRPGLGVDGAVDVAAMQPLVEAQLS